MRRFIILIALLCGLSVTARPQDAAALRPSEEVQHLPAFNVTEPRAADFLVHYGPIERNVGGPPSEERYSGLTRMWLIQWPRPKGQRALSLPPDTAMYVGAAYRGRGLKSDDEIVRISGKLLKDMKPGECVKLFRNAVHYSENKSIEVEVQAIGEKGTRKIIITKAPFNEVIVAKPPVKLDTPFPLPEPTLPTEASRTGK